MRIDKYMWFVRLFKTRSMATDACNTEKVKVHDVFVKASKELKHGDTLAVKDVPIWRTYEVLEFPKSRVGAKLVADFLKETTPDELMHEWELVQKMNAENKHFGIVGRPTKRHRRDLDSFKDID